MTIQKIFLLSNRKIISPSNWSRLFCFQFLLKNLCIAGLWKDFLVKTEGKRSRQNGGVLVLLLLSCYSFCLLIPSVALAQEHKDIEAVKSILFRQQNDWNKGAIDDFMNGYWKSDQLKFVGGNGITYGYDATLRNYHKRYPNRAAMGQLTFGIKNVEKLSRKVIMLVGTWDLARTSGDIGGYFTLMWKKIKGKWVIISDHTSARQ